MLFCLHKHHIYSLSSVTKRASGLKRSHFTNFQIFIFGGLLLTEIA